MFAYAKLTIFYDITYLLLHKLCDKGCNQEKERILALDQYPPLLILIALFVWRCHNLFFAN